MSPARRLGVLGGSFDPVHHGHLHLARAALDRADLDEVVFVPARCPPHKRSAALTPVDVRIRLLKLAIAGEPRFRIDRTEAAEGASPYTYDTLVRMRRENPGAELCFLIGGDSLRDLPKWHRALDLAREFTILTVLRDPARDQDALLAPIHEAFPAEVAARLEQNVLRVEPLPISSTEIRAACERGATADRIERWCPRAVAREIERLGLYRAA